MKSVTTDNSDSLVIKIYEIVSVTFGEVFSRLGRISHGLIFIGKD